MIEENMNDNKEFENKDNQQNGNQKHHRKTGSQESVQNQRQESTTDLKYHQQVDENANREKYLGYSYKMYVEMIDAMRDKIQKCQKIDESNSKLQIEINDMKKIDFIQNKIEKQDRVKVVGKKYIPDYSKDKEIKDTQKESKEKTPEELKIESLKKELENLSKKQQSIGKLVNGLKSRTETMVNQNHINDLENALKLKEKEFKVLQQRQLALTKISIENQKILDNRKQNSEFEEKISTYTKEIKDIKKNIKSSQNQINLTQKKSETIQIQLSQLVENLRILKTSEKNQDQESKNLNTSDNQNGDKSYRKNHSKSHSVKKLIKYVNPMNKKINLDLSPDQKELLNVTIQNDEKTYDHFKQNIKKTKQEINEMKVQQANEMQQLTAKYQQLDTQRKKQQLELKKIETEYQINYYRLSEMKRLAQMSVSNLKLNESLRESAEVRKSQSTNKL